MREIKFRLWDCDNESFSKIDFSDLERTVEELDSFRSYFSGSYFVGENYLQQFTGLQDKNGEEIYEGDIIRWGMHGGQGGEEHWHRYAVVEINPDIQFKIIYYVDSKTKETKPTDNYSFKFGKFAYSQTEKYLEIIGSIHTTPELLNN